MPDERIVLVEGVVEEVCANGTVASFVVRRQDRKAFRYRASPSAVQAVAKYLYGTPVRVVVEVPEARNA